MDIKSYIDKRKNDYNKRELIVYGGNHDDHIFWSIICDISFLITGFDNSVIKFETKPSGQLRYNLKNEKYYYNSVDYDRCYNIGKTNGNGTKIIKKIFEVLDKITEEDFEKWLNILDKIPSLYYYRKCDVERCNSNWDKYIRLDVLSLNKLDKLNNIHKKLVFCETDDIISKLSQILPYWDNNIIENTKFLNTSFYGTFVNNELPVINIKKKKIIKFPDDSRGSICSNFLVTDDLQILLDKKEGDIVFITNMRKGSKQKTYTILEIKEDMVAIKNEENKVEFITWLGSAESCWDCLFDDNKRKFNQWKRKKVNVTENIKLLRKLKLDKLKE